MSLLLAFALLFQNLTIVRSVTWEETEYYVKSTVIYSNSNKEDKVWNFTEREEDRTVGLFMNNSWQTVYLANSTRKIETRKNDIDGNQVAVLQLPKLLVAPGESINFTVTHRVVSNARILDYINETESESLNEIPVSLKEEHSGAEGLWLVNDTEIQNLARNIAGTEPKVLKIVENFVSWIKNNIDYPSQMQEGPQYPNETLIKREGDCDDQAILLVTMCRIVGIPAFLQIGAIYDPSLLTNKSYWKSHVTAVQKRIGWHGWAMVYIPPWRWLPVDLTYVFEPISKDPLNAIKNAAVTSQITIQYMNISKIEYVASSRKARDFLITRNFYVYMEDEMVETIGQKNPFWENVRNIFPLVLVAMIALLLTSFYIIARKLNREEETPTLLMKPAILYQANP